MKFEAHADANGVLTYAECAPDLWFPLLASATGIAPGLEVPERATPILGRYRVTAWYALAPDMVSYSLKSVQLTADSLSGRPPGGGLTIDTEVYRSLRLAEVQDGIGDALGCAGTALSDNAVALQGLPYHGNDDEEMVDDLVETARAYVRASVSGGRPQKAVSEHMGISIATAGRWMRKAAKLGYIPLVFRSDDVPEDRTEKMLKQLFAEPGASRPQDGDGKED